MSLHQLANQLAKKGRNGDSTLVHMTKGEVAGLQALARHHGTTLSRNPDTGLPEAFSLKSLIPMAAGFMLAGPAGMSAMGAGLSVGGAYTLATGDLKKGLMAGLGAYGGAGLGAGTGAASGASQSVTGAGGAPLPEVVDAGSAMNVGPATANPVAQSSVTGADLGSMNPSGQYAQGFQSGSAPVSPYSATSTNTIPQLQGSTSPGGEMMSDMGQTGTSTQTAPTQTYSTTTTAQPVDAVGPPKPTTFERVVSNAEAKPSNIAYSLAPAISEELTPKPYQPEEYKGDADMGQRLAYNSGYSNDIPGRTGPSSYSQISDEDAKRIYGFADGGNVQFPYGESVIRMADGGASGEAVGYEAGPYSGTDYSGYGGPDIGNYSGYDTAPNQGITAMLPTAARASSVAAPENGLVFDPVAKRYVGSNLSDEMVYQGGGKYGMSEAAMKKAAEAAADAFVGNPSYYEAAADGGLMQSYAQGGISTLGGYSDGGRLLRGPGDGVSDSIPAVIGKKQPARLADGEFVVPARIVSEIGNGSTEAGARKLYAMMDRVQRARGKTVAKGKVAKNTRADKYLPA